MFYFGSTMSFIFSTSYTYEPLYWMIIYAIVLIPLIHNGSLFWRTNAILGSLIFVILIVFYIAYPSSANCDFLRNTHSARLSYFNDGFVGFWKALPIPTIFYIGIEVVPLTSEDIAEV